MSDIQVFLISSLYKVLIFSVYCKASVLTLILKQPVLSLPLLSTPSPYSTIL